MAMKDHLVSEGLHFMIEIIIPSNSLVLYKTRPALVKGSGKKLEILLDGGQRLKVRPKDVMLLHPGPIHGLSDLGSPHR